MKVELLAITPDCEKLIEEAGRTCYKSKPGNPEIIKNWIRSGHESMIEHASVTFRVSDVSRSLSHQLVRHRIASYSQESQRYVKQDHFNYVLPVSIQLHKDPEVYDTFMRLIDEIQHTYNFLLEKGVKKEDARAVLPNCCTTELVFTFNFRSLRNFLSLRLDSHAQEEIRILANEILKIVKPLAPNVFFDFAVLDI